MPTFSQKVYQLLKKVPKGKVTTYKALANALGTKVYQAVGQAMKKNLHAPKVPCHRVIKSNGTIGGFMGQIQGKAIQKKKKLLQKEGIRFEKTKSNRWQIQNFPKVLYKSYNTCPYQKTKSLKSSMSNHCLFSQTKI